MTDKSPEDAIREALAGALGPRASGAKPETSLSDLGADDLDRCQIAMELEEALSIEIPDSELTMIDTIADLQNLVAYKLKHRRAAA